MSTAILDSFPTASLIETLAGPLDGRMVYGCGPQALYPYVLTQLAELGHPPRRIRFEANGAPADPTTQPHWPTDAAPDTAEEDRLRLSDKKFGYTHSCVAYPITDVELDV